MKYALVTGGTGSIGAAICQKLAESGCAVIVHTHRRIDAAQAMVESLCHTAAHLPHRAVAFDVTDAEASGTALSELLEAGPIQIVVNNAGIHDDAVFAGMRFDQWHRVIDVSLNGFFNVTQPLMMPMIRTRWGRIINITSVAANIGNRGQVNYAAAKGALQSATRALALEVASRGITVNAIAPGIIASAMTAEHFDAAKISQLVPMKRAGQPEEVADLCAFLASERTAYMTGQILSLNGGMA